MKHQKCFLLAFMTVIIVLASTFGCNIPVSESSTPSTGYQTTSGATFATTREAVSESTTAKASTTTLAKTVTIQTTATATTTSSSTAVSGKLVVHFLDVGQADSILIQQGSASILIDAGNNADDDFVVSYIQHLGISFLDYVVGTHPHEDHIGGLDTVIKNFDIGKVIMPNASNTTQTFEDVLLAIQSKGLKMTKAVPGNEYSLGNAVIEILGPVLASFDDLNDASVVCKITFGNTSFLFEGDAEFASENAMINRGYDLQATVLKVGHHGSNSSTGNAFLSAVNPLFAIICVGADNQYGHPTAATLDKLKAANIKVFRTDLVDTIIATSDGNAVTFNRSPSYGTPGQTEPAATTMKATTIKPTVKPTTAEPGDDIVYITETGSKYHRDGCRYLSKSKIAINRADAIDQGYEPCSICDP